MYNRALPTRLAKPDNQLNFYRVKCKGTGTEAHLLFWLCSPAYWIEITVLFVSLSQYFGTLLQLYMNI